MIRPYWDPPFTRHEERVRDLLQYGMLLLVAGMIVVLVLLGE